MSKSTAVAVPPSSFITCLITVMVAFGSHASPIPSASVSVWVELATVGLVSLVRNQRQYQLFFIDCRKLLCNYY
jgi:hypothetical protein